MTNNLYKSTQPSKVKSKIEKKILTNLTEKNDEGYAIVDSDTVENMIKELKSEIEKDSTNIRHDEF